MSSAQEVEIKFRITDLAEVERKLLALGFRRVTPRTHEMNTLYDLPGQPLRARGELLRLRKYGEKWKLTHKARSTGDGGPHKSREETETGVEDGEKLAHILKALGFVPTFRYEKFRTEFKEGPGNVVLDETPIGNLGEIEGPPKWIDEIAVKIGLARSDYITDTYAGLFFDWKRRTGSRAEEMTFAAVGASR
jgi:adenylate cyclase class 2